MLTFLFLVIFYTAREECLVFHSFFLNFHVLSFESNKNVSRSVTSSRGQRGILTGFMVRKRYSEIRIVRIKFKRDSRGFGPTRDAVFSFFSLLSRKATCLFKKDNA